MNGDQVAAATARTVGQLSSGFMFDPATYAVGGEHGFEGISFYFAGRAGVLGDVDADVAAAALAFFHPDVVRANRDASAGVMPRAEAAEAFAGCGHRWAADHMGDYDWSTLAALAGKVVAGASVAGAPIFAGWRGLPVPDDPRAAALHQLNGLRELRMARHAAAVVVSGVEPGDAVRHRTPHMISIFGWDEAPLGPDVAERWAAAEDLTNRATAHDYAVLDADETAEFTRLCGSALDAVA
jgi:hypothetical protein